MRGAGPAAEEPWRLELAGEARRALQRLPEKVAPAIVEFITGPLAESPLQLTRQLTGELVAYRMARRGDYRVLVRVDRAARSVLVVRIEHRANVYRPR